MTTSIAECRFTVPTRATVMAMAIAGISSTHGQQVVNFNEPWITWQTTPYQNYYEAGMWFRVVAPFPGTPYYSMRRVGNDSGLHPFDGTPYMRWNRDGWGSTDYVVISPSTGDSFGMVSVDLGNSANFSPPYWRDITFDAIKVDNSTVSASFSVPLDSHFYRVSFGQEFTSGLARVEIWSPYWAMDNLVFTIPEPATCNLFALGLLALAGRKWRFGDPPTGWHHPTA